MVSKTNGGPVVIEIDGPKNECLFFRAIPRRVRGRFDVRRVTNPGRLLQKFPQPIPGQRIELDPDNGTGAILEPLHDAEHAAVRDACEAIGTLEPARVEFQDVHVATWAFWMANAVSSGKARLVSGTLPDTEGAKTYFIAERKPDPSDRLAAGIDRLCGLLEKVLTNKG